MRTRMLRPTLLALLASTLTAGVVGGAAAPAAADTFQPRWCGTVPAPCLVSATLNGAPVDDSSPAWDVEAIGRTPLDFFDYFAWVVTPLQGQTPSTSDVWTFTWDTGTLVPRYTEAFAGQPDVVRTDDGDGTHHLTYTARPVLTTEGCDAHPACPDIADSWSVGLYAEVQDLARAEPAGDDNEFNGFDRAQNVDDVNGILLETAPDGSRYLSSEMKNSHSYDANQHVDPYPGQDLQVFHGEARFRIPYQMLKDSFEVPNPATMVASSLSGTVNGSTTGATFTVVNDTANQVLAVDVTGLTFSTKRIKIRRGVITPTRPTQVSASRTARHRGIVDFQPSEARGANVTGYRARCTSGRLVVTGTADGDAGLVRVDGLRRGRAYDCRVRATSQAGSSRWSAEVRLPTRIENG